MKLPLIDSTERIKSGKQQKYIKPDCTFIQTTTKAKQVAGNKQVNEKKKSIYKMAYFQT